MFFRREKFGESESSLLQRAAEWPTHNALESLTAETLALITRQQGIDFATALLFDRFQKSSRHAEFIRRIDFLRQSPSSAPAMMNATVLIVPGALYVDRPDMGGDGRLVREVAESLGSKTDLVPLASVGSVVENARLLRAWLAQNSDGQIILVSLSKAGAEVKMALSAPDASDLFRNVIAWVNVCGPLNGSRLANWILASRVRAGFFRAQYFFQRRDFRFITDMRHGAGGPLHDSLRLPAAMRIVSLVGFPLRRHMTTPLSRFCHRTLATWGPNDGTISLSDLCEWPGDIYPAWGMDHYFRPENSARSLIAAVLHTLTENLSETPGYTAVAAARRNVMLNK